MFCLFLFHNIISFLSNYVSNFFFVLIIFKNIEYLSLSKRRKFNIFLLIIVLIIV